MLKAIIVSVVVHVSIAWLIPSVQILPSPSEYIEVESIWVGTMDETEEVEREEQKVEDDIPEQPQLAHIPTHLDAVEPEMVERESALDTWEADIVGLDPRLPENIRSLAQTDQSRSYTNQLKPGSIETVREQVLAVEDVARRIPEPDVSSVSQPEDDVSLTAEQPYQEAIRYQSAQIPADEEMSPGFTLFQDAELLESTSKKVVSFEKITRSAVYNTSPITPREEMRLDRRDKSDTSPVHLPDTQELPENGEDEIVVTADVLPYSPEAVLPESSDDRMTSPVFQPEITPSSPSVQETYIPSMVQKRPEMKSSIRTSPPLTSDRPLIPIQAEPESKKMASGFQNLTDVSHPAPDTEALAKRLEPVVLASVRDKVPDDRKEQSEVLPDLILPETVSTPMPSNRIEQEKLPVTSRIKPSPIPQEIPSPLISLPPASETRMDSIETDHRVEKKVTRTDDTFVEAVQLRPSQPVQAVSSRSAASDSEEKIFWREVPDRHNPQRGTTLRAQPRHIGEKRSLVFGGEAIEETASSRQAGIGVFVQKERALPQSHEPDVLLGKDDAIERIAPDKGKDELPFKIEGPASGREVLSKPVRLPKVQLDMEVVIRLKFWVLPDGTVGEVIPLQRGDVRLERTVIQYLKGWRFTPVAPDKPKVWGIIPIRYKLQ